jgi:DNA-binding MarR family transcriptional regulator
MPDSLNFDPVAEARRNWARHWGDDPVPSMSAVTSIMRVQQILLARLNDTLKPFDLTFPRYEALMLLYYSRRGALPLGKMGDRLQVHRTSVTNIIDGLEKSGFVTREPHERDRRTTLANITDKGRETARSATEVLNELHFGTLPLGPHELDTITRTLETLRADADGFAPER